MAEPEDKTHLFRPSYHQNKRKFDDIERESEEEIELTLGLSLNGRFGTDPNRRHNAPLVRSSSVSEFVFSGGGAAAEESPETAAGLVRTWSLPAAGAEEEWRRRKEAQSARRMEAKRKRVEKMVMMSEKVKDRSRSVEGKNGPIGERHVAIGSQGSGSSLGCEAGEGRVINQGTNIPVETRSSGSVQSQQKDPIGATQTDKPSSAKSTNHEAKEMMKNMMVDMPCVSTRGVGPSGKRIEGFLYRYKNGEEVRIVCVCHGSFLSPAEFVKHAGGGDVAQPLKHIVVNPSPLM